jgi:hypothetical protein
MYFARQILLPAIPAFVEKNRFDYEGCCGRFDKESLSTFFYCPLLKGCVGRQERASREIIYFHGTGTLSLVMHESNVVGLLTGRWRSICGTKRKSYIMVAATAIPEQH